MLSGRQFYRSFTTKTLPVITVPKYLEAEVKKHEKMTTREIREILHERSQAGNRRKPVITSKMRPELNFYYGQTYYHPNPYKQPIIPLASEGWLKGGKYQGDVITIHPVEKPPYFPESQVERWSTKFSTLLLSEDMVEALKILGYHSPSNVQCQAIPSILSRENVILSAEAGSGKTIAYLAPILQTMSLEKRRSKSRGIPSQHRSPRGIIVVPSKELAEQIGRIALKLATQLDLGVTTMVSGGASVPHTGLDLLIATAGLVNDLAGIAFQLDNIHHLVLDEADTLLDDSFNTSVIDLMHRLKVIGKGSTQVVLVGATIPSQITKILGDQGYPREAFSLVTGHMNHRVPLHIHQTFERMHKHDRDAALLRIVSKDIDKGNTCMIFCNRTKTSNFISQFLMSNNIPCSRLNKTVDREERKEIIERFNSNDIEVLSCTDVASRGLDTSRVNHVINFEFPFYASDYLHRIGRTGRLGSKSMGRVTNIISFKPDAAFVQKIEYAIRTGKTLEGIDGNITKQLEEFHIKKYGRAT